MLRVTEEEEDAIDTICLDSGDTVGGHTSGGNSDSGTTPRASGSALAAAGQQEAATAVTVLEQTRQQQQQQRRPLTTLSDLLTEHVDAAMGLLQRNHEIATRLVARITEATAQIESDNAKLGVENHALREKLIAAGLNVGFCGFADTGGSGDASMLHKTPKGEQSIFDTVAVVEQQPRRKGSKQHGWAPPPNSIVSSAAASRAPNATVTVGLVEPVREPIQAFGPTEQTGPQPPASAVPNTPEEHAPAMTVPGSIVGAVRTETTADAAFIEKQRSKNRLDPSDGSRSPSSMRLQRGSGSDVDEPRLVGIVPTANDELLSEEDESIKLLKSQKAERRMSGLHREAAKLKLEVQKAEALKAKKAGEDDEAADNKKQGPKAVFADAAALKEKLRRNLGKPEYNVANYYHKDGIWPYIATNHMFEHLTLAVIGINALWISVDTDSNDADMILDAKVMFQVAENLFCSFFTFEWFARFMSFRKKKDGLRDGWFVFDTTLVWLMIFETWVMSSIVYLFSSGSSSGPLGNAGILKLLRLMRLSRMARMARLFKAMPELMIMIKGMSVAMRSVFFTLFLLVCICYVFAIAFVQLMGPRGALQPLSDEWDPQLFSSVPVAMNTLLLDGTMPDEAGLINAVGNENPIMRIVIMIFVLLAGLTVMNMLVGVLCEVVSVVSAVEKESLLVNFVKAQLQEMLESSGFDANHDNQISREEFESLLEKPEAARALMEVGVDVVGLVDFTDFIFKDHVELSFPDFMDVVLQLRGSNTATVKDIVDLRKLVVAEFQNLNSVDRKGYGYVASTAEAESKRESRQS